MSEQAPQALTVTQLTALLKDVLESQFPDVWVSGEISDLSQSHAGHIYFSLKDAKSQVRGVIWAGVASRLRFKPQDGLAVLCRGAIELYAPRGTYQLIVRQMEPQGEGALQLALRQLHAKLAREGLFDARHKQPLPSFPRHVAVVTSPTGAAIRDFLEVAKRRWPALRVTVIPARVQGVGATQDLVRGIESANAMRPAPDILVVARGGGSLEDLWSFNEEPLVRAVFASRLPVVSAVGHEIDVTLCDLAADVRALTPTEAAELVTPSRDELAAQLAQTGERLRAALRRRSETARRRLAELAERRCFRRPFDRIHEWARRADELDERLTVALRGRLRRGWEQWRQGALHLEALSPLAVLTRGYSVTMRAAERPEAEAAEREAAEREAAEREACGSPTSVDQPLTEVTGLNSGELLKTQLAGGLVWSRVERVEAKRTGERT